LKTAALHRNEPARAAEISLGGVGLVLDRSGVLYAPAFRTLIVSDLHLEKGSSFARRGVMLPPYDTRATLARLTEAIAFYAPLQVVALGDSFHDGDGPARLSPDDRATLGALQCGRDWIWVTGNHDPKPAAGIGGAFADSFAIGGIVCRHEPAGAAAFETAGHFHPVARVSVRGRSLRRRCFATDGRLLLLPAFGAFTGGLNLMDPAIGSLFSAARLSAFLLGDEAIYAFPASECLPG
jgi:DNA ligase-associated metallophosphoesterase